MKITLLVLLSMVAFVVCTVPEPFKKPEQPKNCWCKKGDCTDTSCEDKACLCIVNAIKKLIEKGNLKYPEKWLKAYLELVQYRCLCIKRCQNICTPKDYLECVWHAFKVFNCKYTKFLAGIKGDKGYADFIKDITRILRECLKNDCKPVCSGDSDCNSYHTVPKDCTCAEKCINEEFALLKKDSDDGTDDLISDLQVIITEHLQETKHCSSTYKNSKQVEWCIVSRREQFDREYDEIIQKLLKLGVCRGINHESLIQQIGANCLNKGK